MNENNTPIHLCAQAYLEYYRSHFRKYEWAADYIDSLIYSDITKAIDVINDLCLSVHNNLEMAFVYGGPIEDFFHAHPLKVLKQYQSKISRLPLDFKQLNQFVWTSKGSQAEENIEFFMRRGRKPVVSYRYNT